MERIRIQLLRSAALLLLLGLLTGIYVSAGMTGKIAIDGQTALASHLNALMGAFLLFGFAQSLPHLKYGSIGAGRIAVLLVVANYANWLLTAIKAALHVRGIDWTGVVTNDLVFLALSIFVVLPSLGGVGFWVLGFGRRVQ
ncbi:MAG: hypothetical protein H7A21_16755 [Spirochaetales bacterium]|nr:hypothetical protein [Leptospiraceae bacterium]MCP5483089.1 hypothetical protein [Spirochaetales bacterium]MCP5486103.1 hypothetical protein [Spirochaetales bacterium]